MAHVTIWWLVQTVKVLITQFLRPLVKSYVLGLNILANILILKHWRQIKYIHNKTRKKLNTTKTWLLSDTHCSLREDRGDRSTHKWVEQVLEAVRDALARRVEEMQSRPTALWLQVQNRIITWSTTGLLNILCILLSQLRSSRNRQQEGRGTSPWGMRWEQQETGREGECCRETEFGDHARGVWGDGPCIMQQSDRENEAGVTDMSAATIPKLTWPTSSLFVSF